METFNKLSTNLQQIILDKIFKKQKEHYNKLINQQIKNLSNDLSSIYDDSFTPYILERQHSNITKHKDKFLDITKHASTNYIIEKCDFCNHNGCIIKSKDIPYYNTHLFKKNVYKTKQNYKQFYQMRFIEKNRLNYRCSWYTTFMCASCYHGINNKNISTQFYCSI